MEFDQKTLKSDETLWPKKNIITKSNFI
jgi:hypothetical protein